MITKDGLHNWAVKHLQDPFLEAELYKTDSKRWNESEESSRVIATALVLIMPLILVAVGVMHF